MGDESFRQHVRFGIRQGRAILLIIGVLCGLAQFAKAVLAQEPPRPVVETNAAYVEAVTRHSALAVNDKMAVFDLVLSSLPERVKVYPTENYFYFRFTHKGVRYAGDMRFDVEDRDQGKRHFGYVEELTAWNQGDESVDADDILDARKGVAVVRLDRLSYRVTYRNKSVVFELNDLSQVKPPAGALAPDEQFVGPIFDESAIRFFFVYNTRLKIFHFVLDETVNLADRLVPIKQSDRILIGKRTGFAFYCDQMLMEWSICGFRDNPPTGIISFLRTSFRKRWLSASGDLASAQTQGGDKCTRVSLSTARQRPPTHRLRRHYCG